MNGKVSKMLRKINANDKRSKRLFQDLTADQKARIRAVYDPRDPGKALIAFGRAIGNIE